MENRNIPTQEVTGSNPVLPTTQISESWAQTGHMGFESPLADI